VKYPVKPVLKQENGTGFAVQEVLQIKQATKDPVYILFLLLSCVQLLKIYEKEDFCQSGSCNISPDPWRCGSWFPGNSGNPRFQDCKEP